MMLPSVVSDSGPLIHLAQIGKLPILRKLFCTVLISQQVKIEVYDEGLKLGCADAEAVGIALKEGWIKIEATPKRLTESAKKLAYNENISWADAETPLLAVHKKAELLVDERMLSKLSFPFFSQKNALEKCGLRGLWDGENKNAIFTTDHYLT